MSMELVKSDAGANVTPFEERRPRALYRPATDIFETDDAVVLELELPGVARDSVDVSLENRVLTIRGQTPRRKREGWQQIYAEYGEGDYERVFSLSEEIDRDKIQASFRNGVLRLELPKVDTAKTRRINVKAA
ncbi:Hsp20/alpha crystallin family protein [Amphiplicatus metriothermophilus]|uniref:Molecular chaperone IbpA, HSP20 family n=1 Tax=Amphiplicatus metriothermophilus TaxID=1519374 RepID=A0A239PQ98_9PROT|nr:Hsp20/alpha crystallin family protein [Amphiplicatus metriothermophilus]MBB5518619.1 HSP20 family molecular chaperone IbpA [Amphiplicatus metriothermophilus]SNT72223.1 Molecular chaperone IbpA, HSP20 family [Amphiplicatus metriothermophilus]